MAAMTKRLLTILLAALLLAAACTGTTATVPDTTTTAPAVASPATPPIRDAGVQLVTEAELILHAAEATAQSTVDLIAAMFSGGNPAHITCIYGDPITASKTRQSTGRPITQLSYHFLYNAPATRCDVYDEGFNTGSLDFHFTFSDSPAYADGKVDVGSCRKLPGAGTKTTGEYRELSNETDNVVERTISHTVEESKSTETSLSETLDLTSGQTVEAGASFPGGEVKGTVSFEEHFGLEKGSVDSTSNTNSETVEDKQEIEPDQIIAASFHPRRLDQRVRHRHRLDGHMADHHRRRLQTPLRRLLPPGDILIDHGVISRHGRTVTFTFDGSDDLVRLALGHDTGCDGCTFDLGYWGRKGLDALDSHEGQRIKLNGTRHRLRCHHTRRRRHTHRHPRR